MTNTMKPVVVGVGGSEASQDALDWAVREAQLTGRSLRVLYSYTLAPGSAPMDKVLREIGNEVLDAANARVRAPMRLSADTTRKA